MILLTFQVYKFIVDTFPYYQNAPSDWKNSVRHTLCMNQAFVKIAKYGITKAYLGPSVPGTKHSCFWAIDPERVGKLVSDLKNASNNHFSAIQRAMADPDTLPELMSNVQTER